MRREREEESKQVAPWVVRAEERKQLSPLNRRRQREETYGTYEDKKRWRLARSRALHDKGMRNLTVEEVYETEFQTIRKRQAKLLVEEELKSLNSDLKSLAALKAKYALKRRASMYETAKHVNDQQRLILPESHSANAISLKHWIVLTNHEIRESEQRDLAARPSSPSSFSPSASARAKATQNSKGSNSRRPNSTEEKKNVASERNGINEVGHLLWDNSFLFA